jgi:hypothetical protein
LTIEEADNRIEKRNDTLFSMDLNGPYKWINCNNNTIVKQGISNFYVPSENGSYAVVIEKNICLDTSECIVIEGLSLDELIKGAPRIYPNPAFSEVSINIIESSKIEVLNNLGELVYSGLHESGTFSIDLGFASAGIYFVKIHTGNNLFVNRLVLLK